jgi:cyclopropane fatty-acyl-phospholipid synthase-like methyltransferase
MAEAHMTNADFEALYQSDPDPWAYESSDYERRKYDATLTACGEGPHDHALELGSSIGVFSARLAARCHSLLTIDAAPSAVAVARRRLSAMPWAQARIGEIPEAIPQETFDLVVASEILYYLEPDALAGTFARLSDCLAPHGRLVTVHWRPAGPERPFTAAEVHARLGREAWLSPVLTAPTDDYLLDVLERV